MRATSGARNLNLQVAITRAWHVCSQLSFGLPLKNVATIRNNVSSQ